jgi:KUP system potassium uptake protein
LVWNVSHLRNHQITQNTVVLKAINPYYAYHFTSIHPEGFFCSRICFPMCTTGAEALYSDMGHCGRKNIRISWVFVKLLSLKLFRTSCLLCNTKEKRCRELVEKWKSILLIMPDWFQPRIVIATLAAAVMLPKH